MKICQKCASMCGGLFFVFGLLFLLRDFGVWNFWNIQWWSIAFLMIGLGIFGASKCPMCQGKK